MMLLITFNKQQWFTVFIEKRRKSLRFGIEQTITAHLLLLLLLFRLNYNKKQLSNSSWVYFLLFFNSVSISDVLIGNTDRRRSERVFFFKNDGASMR